MFDLFSSVVGSGFASTVVYAPDDFSSFLFGKRPVLFLAGSIDMGKAVDWQSSLCSSFGFFPSVFLNPRRLDWDSSWVQSINDPQFSSQVNWELSGLDSCDLIILYLSKSSSAPISLLELGLHAGSGKIVVCCESGFYRSGNVEIVCSRYGVPFLTSFSDLVTYVSSYILDFDRLSRTSSIRSLSDRVSSFESRCSFVYGMHSLLRTRPDYGIPDHGI